MGNFLRLPGPLHRYTRRAKWMNGSNYHWFGQKNNKHAFIRISKWSAVVLPLTLRALKSNRLVALVWDYLGTPNCRNDRE